MKALERLEEHLKTRMAEVNKLRAQGRKVIGYTPGGFFPEELVWACGGLPVPVGLNRGGEHEPVMVAGSYLPRWLDTFARAQIGYYVLKEELAYQMLDLLVVPVTDSNIRAIADVFACYTPVKVFRFGVPHKKTDHGYAYYLDGIRDLKEKLEEITGAKIEDARLREQIDLANRERALLSEISEMRKADRPPITGRDFMRLNHASFLTDKKFMVETLELLRDELKKKEAPALKGPRILLTGSTLAFGDYQIYDLIEAPGGEVVIEEFAEGIRHYQALVRPDGNLMDALADRYYTRRIPPGWFRPGTERYDNICKLAKDYKVDGVIWYQLMYKDTYDMESYYFLDILKSQTGLPMLKIESDYDSSERGPFRTRVETFIDTIRK